ncbi:hypothetical protein [Streptomyces albidoflavus]|nr:hypothetical protein [Streptomyces albidoflavus]
MVLEELAEVSARVAATSSRSRKTELLAELFAKKKPPVTRDVSAKAV